MEKLKNLIRGIVKEELDTDLNELARISEKVKIGDKAKADKIKKLYSNAGAFKWIADIIEIIEKAGDGGIARMDAIDALHKEFKHNKTQQEINPKLKDLLDSGVILSAGLSQPKAEKNVGGDRGRPTSEKTQIARQIDAKLQDNKEYQPTEDELNALGAEFIEKLRKRAKGELKRGRPVKDKGGVEDVLEEGKDYETINKEFPGHAKRVNPITSPQYKWYLDVLEFVKGNNPDDQKSELIKKFQRSFFGMDYGDENQSNEKLIKWWLSDNYQKEIKTELNSDDIENQKKNIRVFLNSNLDELKQFLRIRYRTNIGDNEELTTRIDKIEGVDYDGTDSDVTPYPGEFGISFNWPGSSSLNTEEDEPKITTIGGEKIAYVGYNI